MEEILKTVLYTTIVPGFMGIGVYFVNSILARLKALEHELPTKVVEAEVRQLLNDKLDPLREDINDLKIKLDKIVDLLLSK